MAQYITASGATSIGQANAILIQVNTALTGTITITNAGSTQYSTASGTIAVITNPTAGATFRYGGLNQQGAISVNPSGTTDITVTKLNRIH